MAKARALVKRRASIRNLRKITHTMNLIATTRYQKNLKRISSFRPFAVNVTGVSTLVRSPMIASRGIPWREA